MTIDATQSYVTIQTRHGPMLVRYVCLDGREGVSLRAANLKEGVVPVRIQSSCLFSESLGAVDCDCAAQLARSLEIAAQEGGLVVYCYEEGRGAGLRAKFEAIALQAKEQIDTAEAYRLLGLQKDPRDYKLAAKVITEELEAGSSVELLTNNPDKEKMLAQQGIRVYSRRSLFCAPTEHAEEHLRETALALGHDFETHRDNGE